MEISNEDTQLVRRIARRYAMPNVPEEDLIQEGYIGLIEAYQNYNPETGIQFHTYASWWVRKAILEALNQYGNIVCIPRNNTSVKERCISESLDKVVRVEDGEALTYNELIPDDTPNADEQMMHEAQLQAMRDALGALPPRMRTIVCGIHGINCKPRTRPELARELGIDIKKVYKLYKKAKKKLREGAKISKKGVKNEWRG